MAHLAEHDGLIGMKHLITSLSVVEWSWAIRHLSLTENHLPKPQNGNVLISETHVLRAWHGTNGMVIKISRLERLIV